MKLSKKGVAVRAALGVHLKPLLASDAAIDLAPLISDPKGKLKTNAAIVKAVIGHAKGKLAHDMDIDPTELGEIIAMAAEAVEDDPEPTAADPAEDDGDTVTQVVAALTGKISDEDLEKIKAILGGGQQAQDEDDETTKKDDDKKDDKVDKTAMDAALKQTRVDTIAEMRALQTAEEEVRPLIGAVAAMDSAEAIYKLALDAAKVDLEGVHPSAYRSLVRMQSQVKSVVPAPRVALDAAAEQSFAEAYPGAGKLKRS